LSGIEIEFSSMLQMQFLRNGC